MEPSLSWALSWKPCPWSASSQLFPHTWRLFLGSSSSKGKRRVINLLNWQSNGLPYWQLRFHFVVMVNMGLTEISLVCLSRAADWTLCDTAFPFKPIFICSSAKGNCFNCFVGKVSTGIVPFCFQPYLPSLVSPKWQAQWQLCGHLCFWDRL